MNCFRRAVPFQLDHGDVRRFLPDLLRHSSFRGWNLRMVSSVGIEPT